MSKYVTIKCSSCGNEMYADGTIQAIAANYTEYGVPGYLIQK